MGISLERRILIFLISNFQTTCARGLEEELEGPTILRTFDYTVKKLLDGISLSMVGGVAQRNSEKFLFKKEIWNWFSRCIYRWKALNLSILIYDMKI